MSRPEKTSRRGNSLERLDAPGSIDLIQHQFRNKLGIVTGTIELMRLDETLSDEGRADLIRMKHACEDMLAMVDSLSPESSS